MEIIKVKVVADASVTIPDYKTRGAAAMDVCANILSPITLKPFERKLIPTGLRIQLPEGYEAQVRPRSGLALNNGITVLNSPGTIDADYRGEIGVILINLSNETYVIQPRERIAQLKIASYVRAEMVQVEFLDETERGDGAWGHTGK